MMTTFKFPHLFRPALLAMALLASSFTMAPGGRVDADEKLLIDGKEVTDASTIELEQDDTIYLEAYGLKPSSDVNVIVKKMGVRWGEQNFRVDKTGAIKAIFNVVDQKITVSCTVSYYDSENHSQTKEFKVKVK